ncbi:MULTISPECIES: DNA repair protein RecN [unclassified Ruminococcus]|uniref:DNA repair protein RecN n=1 Tax=unclassified Ruminococcus TaxID=2608920 RepID=UPI00210CAA82|nr:MULTISPECIES: DNA repair protein RecN [unclassified Ruminococcus]MCQ4022262.1 DNA repair protein RecN [Ruminococcus sp. zg-924]MCQ4114590.1 DNA repair protein RecN [Ruminococcus sp. zg-921]
MLDTLYIENIAVIEKTSIDFTEGFNVLTGETGAGKSIVIDSINAVLGNRTSKELIRTGAKKAVVSAQFSDISDKTVNVLEKLGCKNDDEPKSLVINREISASGKNLCRVNCIPVPVAVLKEIGLTLIDIHGQMMSYELMNGEKHREYIDDYANTALLLGEYRQVFHQLKDCKHRLDKAETDDNERESRIDILKYQINEIEQADVKDGELELLKEQRIVCRNREKIAESLAYAYAQLCAGEEYSVLSAIQNAVQSLGQTSALVPELAKIAERLDNVYYEIDDCIDCVSSVMEERENDEISLEDVENRLDLVQKIIKKYGPEYSDIQSFLENGKKELQSLLSYEENMEALLDEYNELATRALGLANEISQLRKTGAQEFVAAVEAQLTYLDMPNVRLVVNIEKTKLTENGIDKIELLISANPGEEPKPVSKIASGGELSRIMLSINNVLTDSDSASTMIFDEVDAGISGSASQKVGQKLKAVSSGRQVICVTHQAQIAALADTHFLIKKNVRDGKTFTEVKKLSYEQRKTELARIIDGLNITEISLRHAEEMMNKK